MKKTLFLWFLLIHFLLIVNGVSQQKPIPTSAEERLSGIKKKALLIENSIVNKITFRSAGPTVMSGRVTDLDVNPANPTHFYVAYASGGLWVTKNNGISFDPVFDHEAVMSIGDIAVNWNDSIIWVGTGENNSSRSSYSGMGIYKSSDMGKTWIMKGLYDSHHIGRIILHPENPDILWVASMGHLYSANEERGVFKSLDGGNTWNKVLYVNNITGAIDLVIDPMNPDVLYAAMWERMRMAWDFQEAGKGSGIYKSSDGGKTWQHLSALKNGLPAGEGLGRIGLDIAPTQPNIIYAYIDNQNLRENPEEDDDVGMLTRDKLRKMSKKEFLNINSEIIQKYLTKNRFPKEYDAATVIDMVSTGQILPVALVDYLEDANAALFDTPVIGAEVYRSDNGGMNWQKMHEGYLDDIMYSYGYYFGEIRVSPFDENKIYIMGVPILKSTDGGKNFTSIDGPNVHADHHALWLNPLYNGHLINGNDGGVNISYDDGNSWFKANTPAVGQFYSVNYDWDEPYNIYGGLQDNGIWVGPSDYIADVSWHASGHYPYKNLMGGDGMQVEIDSRDNNTIYTGFQFGNYYKLNKITEESSYIKPGHKLGEKPLRFNWQTPIHLSKHNEDILYLGSNKFHRSMDGGLHFQTMTEDLTRGEKQGDIAYGTLTTIHESPLKFGLIYVGTDDGLIYRTDDGGYNWNNISTGLPEHMWISRVVASTHNENLVFASLNGYRWDFFDALIYRSVDYGKTWEKIGNDLPPEPVNVIAEDPVNSSIVYVGTDHGLYVSLDWGESFMALTNGLPAVAVHDLKIHPRDKDLIVGTHGRSIYIADVESMQLLHDSIYEKELYIFEPEPVKHSGYWGKSKWSKWYGYYETEIKISLYSNLQDSALFIIKDKNEMVLFQDKYHLLKGLNFINYNLTISPEIAEAYEASLNEDSSEEIKVIPSDNGNFYLKPGSYIIEIAIKNQKATSTLTINK